MQAAPDVPAGGERVTAKEADMADTSKAGSNSTGPATPTATAPTTPTPTPTAEPVVAAQPAQATAAPASPTPPAASFAELNAEFGDDPAFVCECQKEGRSMADAHKAYGRKMKAECEGLRKLGTAGSGGAQPVNTGGRPAGAAPGGDANDYEAEIRRVAAADKLSIPAATGKVNKERPDLRIAYIEKSRRLQHAGGR
jgi:predicted component of type VI protein secretion system